MTIKNKKTKQSNQVASSSGASTSVQKTSSSTTSSSTVQKVSSGKKVRYIEVKVEEDDPLMITDVTDHGSVTGSTISEHYNSHPHYIITEAPSMSDLSQTKSLGHHASDMALSTTGEFVSSSVLQESSSQQQSSKSETYQSSSTSVQQSGSSQNQTFDRTMDSSSGNQTLNTAFLDSNAKHLADSSSTFLTRSQGANATNSFLQSERQDILDKQTAVTNQTTSSKSGSSKFTSTDQKNTNRRDNTTYQNSPQPSKRGQTEKSNTSNFYGGEGSLDKDSKTKQFSSTSQSSESKSSCVVKSSSSSYVVEIVDGKERIIDSSHREWGDAKEQATSEAYASVSGTGIKPQTAHSMQNYDMKSRYDTGKDGKKPTSELTIKEDAKFIKDGSQVTSHANYIKEKDNSIEQQYTSTQGQVTSKDNQSNVTQDKLNANISAQDHSSSSDYHQLSNITEEQISSSSQNYTTTTTSTSDDTIKTNKNNIKSTDNTTQDKRHNVNKTDSSNFYGYDATVQNELKKVGDILHAEDSKNFNFSTKIMKSNTSSAQQATSSSYRVEIVDGKERIVDTSNREWGDSKEHATYEKSHNVGGTGIKPQHEYSRHVLDKESHYDTGKDGVPTSSNYVLEESALYKDGKQIAYTSNTQGGDYTKKKAITEKFNDTDDVLNRRIQDATDENIHSSSYQSTSVDQSTMKDSTNVQHTTEFLSTEKKHLTKETSSTVNTDTKDTLTTYERSTGTWNGKFIYEKDDDRPKRKKEQPRHHLKRQDTEENIILSSRDIKDFTSISDLRKIIETTQSNKNVTVSDKSIVINRRTIDDRVLKDIIDTVKKYPFKRIDKVSFGTKINEDVKDLYEGVDTEELTTIVNTANAEFTKKSFEVEKTKSQVEVTRYIIENGIKTKITTYEDAKEDDKLKTNVFVDKSAMDVTNLVCNLIT